MLAKLYGMSVLIIRKLSDYKLWCLFFEDAISVVKNRTGNNFLHAHVVMLVCLSVCLSYLLSVIFVYALVCMFVMRLYAM